MARAATLEPKGKAPAPAAIELRWSSPLLLALTSFATALVAAAALVALPHDPYIRYQQLAKTIQFRSQWRYERIEFDPTPIDIAIIGNSRLEAGVSGPGLQSQLRARLDRPLNVANLAMPQEGRNMHYVLVERLLARHPEVKLLILSVIERMPRDGHPAFRDLADVRDVINAPVLLNRDYLDALAALPYRQLSLFIQSQAPTLFGDAPRLDPKHYAGPNLDSSKSFRLPDGRIVDREKVHSATELAEQRAAKPEGRARFLPSAAGDLEFAVERHYTRQIAALARARGAKLIFLYLPGYADHRGIGDLGFYQRLGSVLDFGSFADNPGLFADYGHFNRFGTRLATARLAKLLSARLEARSAARRADRAVR